MNDEVLPAPVVAIMAKFLKLASAVKRLLSPSNKSPVFLGDKSALRLSSSINWPVLPSRRCLDFHHECKDLANSARTTHLFNRTPHEAGKNAMMENHSTNKNMAHPKMAVKIMKLSSWFYGLWSVTLIIMMAARVLLLSAVLACHLAQGFNISGGITTLKPLTQCVIR